MLAIAKGSVRSLAALIHDRVVAMDGIMGIWDTYGNQVRVFQERHACLPVPPL